MHRETASGTHRASSASFRMKRDCHRRGWQDGGPVGRLVPALASPLQRRGGRERRLTVEEGVLPALFLQPLLSHENVSPLFPSNFSTSWLKTCEGETR